MRARASRRLPFLVRRFRGRRVAVVGDLMLDRFLRGSVRRISPEAPVPVVVVNEQETIHPGGAGNVAANLAALGARPTLFAVTGADEAGHEIRRLLQRQRIGTAGLLRDAGRPTTVKTRIIADHQQVVRADWEDTRPLDAHHQRRLLTALRRQAPRLDAVVLSDYDKGVLTELLLGELLELCRAKRVPVFIDLKRPRALEPGVTLVLLNQRRAEELSGSGIENDNRLGIVGRSLMAQFPCKVLVITRGSAGMVVFENHDRFHFEAVRTRPWEVFDVTGAGDTVLATLTLATVAGAVPREAVALANAAAGIVVGKLGTAVCTPRELLAALR